MAAEIVIFKMMDGSVLIYGVDQVERITYDSIHGINTFYDITPKEKDGELHPKTSQHLDSYFINEIIYTTRKKLKEAQDLSFDKLNIRAIMK